ncbi:MAG: hypothetical protein CMO55_19930 [Verrucomicrobiales bacterium]|nr:hypothetical protein [Verrucomicrobiales bacterium]
MESTKKSPVVTRLASPWQSVEKAGNEKQKGHSPKGRFPFCIGEAGHFQTKYSTDFSFHGFSTGC